MRSYKRWYWVFYQQFASLFGLIDDLLTGNEHLMRFWYLYSEMFGYISVSYKDFIPGLIYI